MKWKQQGLSVTNLDIMNPFKPFSTDKYKNWMEPQKLERINYFTKELLELIYQGFGEDEFISWANITADVEKLIVCHKVLLPYIEGDGVYI